MANVNTPDSRPSLMTIPPNYPMYPAAGKISLLFEANSYNLYHKYNARDYDNGNIWFGSNQPYIYRYPDERPSWIRTLGGRGLPFGAGVDDLERLTKFIVSGRGLLFVGKQFVMQGFQPFDETNIYNPTEVLLSAAANLTGQLINRPKRHIDKSGGLLGGLAALVGVSVSRGHPPASTVAASGGKSNFVTGAIAGGGSREEEVLPVQNYGNATGLLRAKTALKAKGILQAKWGADTTEGSGGGILGMVKNIAKSIFPQIFRADSQAGIKQRADELAYDWMIKYYNAYTAQGWYRGVKTSGVGVSFMGINLKKQTKTPTAIKMVNAAVGSLEQKYYYKTEGGSIIYDKEGAYIRAGDEKSPVKLQFYDASQHGEEMHKLQAQKNTYFDESSWKVVDENSTMKKGFDLYKKEGERVTSGELVQLSSYNERYESYNGESKGFDITYDNTGGIFANKRAESQNTKLNKKDDTDQINDSLKRVINKIQSSGIYDIKFDNKDTWLFSSGEPSKQGYDRLYDIAKNPNVEYDPNSVKRMYISSDTKTIDSNGNPLRNMGFSGAGKPDKINTLSVLGGRNIDDMVIPGYTEWRPYEDDIIAFFFYDVVNDRYIPFRATIKGISEGNSAVWDSVRFIGRADELFSYSGFSRTLGFSFTVVVSSIAELWPVWNRINYLASSVKPSAYTKRVHKELINRFVVPPMMMLTIGDLYKYQPVIINTVNVNIPENASWETTPEDDSEEWTHLSNIIKTKISGERIGQFPREAEITVACNVLEKEIPIMGGTHYGHSPYDENGKVVQGQNVPYLPLVHPFSENIRTPHPVG